MKDNTKKKSLALFISLCALFIFTGSLVAYFSDMVTGTANVEAGTLDIVGTYELYYNGTEENKKVEGNSLKNFNPGDYVVVKATVTNLGTKSATLRHTLKLEGGLADEVYGDRTPVISVFEGDKIEPQNALSLTNNTYTPLDKIINGTVEEEGINNHREYTFMYIVYFNPGALNSAQGKGLEINFEAKALQYQNNTSPAEGLWDNIIEFEFNPQP